VERTKNTDENRMKKANSWFCGKVIVGSIPKRLHNNWHAMTWKGHCLLLASEMHILIHSVTFVSVSFGYE